MFPVQSGAALSSLSSALLLAAPIAGAPKNPQNDHSKHTSLGLLTYCFGLAQKARAELPDIPDYNDPIAFICEAARFGADAVQIPFGIRDVGSIRAIRNIAEQLGVALESTLGLPQTDSDIAKFETEMQTLRELGVSIVRTVVFPGRRYEDLHSYGAYESALKNAKDRIRRAEPIAKKHDIKLAIENHKDQRIDERVRLFKEFESEYIGACVDVGNNIALLEDPVEVSRALAPWALTAHFKDQGVREYEDGFLLADVPLGQGCIDLPNVVRAVREKRPNIHLQLELITRDALKVPVLNESYWATFPEVKASELSRTWAMIKERASRAPFPEVSRLSAAEKVALERRNIEESFRYAAKKSEFLTMNEIKTDRAGSKQSRRSFLKTSGMAFTALSASRVFGANERVNVGVIGFGLIGQIHTKSFMDQSDVDIAAVADAYSPRVDAGAALAGSRCKKYHDFRELLGNKDIDAVVVATPDHWHALMTMMACAAGKDVYCEKPLTLFVKEGRWLIDVAKKHKRIVQVGVQNRSGPNFQRAGELIRAGKLGELVSIQNSYYRNVSPGFGNPPDQTPPPEMDYDMWLGPAPKRPYNPNRSIYHFRWFWDYSGGQMTNLGQHSLDLVHFFLGVTAPKSVYSSGGRFHLKDNCEVPDTQDAIIEYPGFNVTCQYREASGGAKGTGMGGLIFYGTKGYLPVGRTGFELVPDAKVNPQNAVARVLPEGHPVGGPQPVPEPAKKEFWTDAVKDDTGDAMKDYRRHARNFLDCVKSRKQPIADLQNGHQVVTVCHLANISLKIGRKLVWDATRDEVVGDNEANAMLTRPYREPWDRELKALLA